MMGNKNSNPYGIYDGIDNEIHIENVNNKRLETSIKYNQYVDSLIFHELIHAVNFHKKLWKKVTYDPMMMGEPYYSNSEEIRAYKAQIKNFLIGHLGLSRNQTENMMNKYSSDQSDTRKKWINKYHDLKKKMIIIQNGIIP